MQSWLWIPLAIGSAFFAALVAIFGKIGLRDVSATVLAAAHAGIAFLVMLLALIFLGKTGELNTLSGKPGFYVLLAGLCGAISWILYYSALKIGKASRVGPLDKLSLIFVVILAALILGEKIGLKVGLGALLMGLGAILIALG